ncbi:MAG TPA: PhzF family phenazine biosynthesis isomerase [Candidatus Bathyarchaeia archaeon]
MEPVPFYHVDAFTETPFKGNPAAICFMNTRLQDSLYLAVSAEMNLSETAFAEPEGEGVYRLRWFTPRREVPLCGHATLALAHVLFNERGYRGDELTFKTASGDLHAYRGRRGVQMDFPRNDPKPVAPIKGILDGLGVGEYVAFQYSDTNQKLLVELGSEEQVRSVSPNFKALLAVNNTLGWRGVIVTSRSAEYDFVSRYFAPWMGVDEDPVTGSAHTVLGPYWAEKLGKTSLRAYQASSRGGALRVDITDGRVNLVGGSVIVVRGSLSL